MQKIDVNPLANFDGVSKADEDASLNEPNWDELVIGPCVSSPGWSDGDDGYKK